MVLEVDIHECDCKCPCNVCDMSDNATLNLSLIIWMTKILCIDSFYYVTLCDVYQWTVTEAETPKNKEKRETKYKDVYWSSLLLE